MWIEHKTRVAAFRVFCFSNRYLLPTSDALWQRNKILEAHGVDPGFNFLSQESQKKSIQHRPELATETQPSEICRCAAMDETTVN